MPQPPIDPALELFEIGTLLLSIVACMNVIFMRRSGPVLPYEPRRPVPWGPVVCILAAYFLSAALLAPRGDDADSSQPVAPSALIVGILVELSIVGGILFFVAVLTKATPRDLGLPANVDQWMRDLCIGGAACLAALAPVHIL